MENNLFEIKNYRLLIKNANFYSSYCDIHLLTDLISIIFNTISYLLTQL